MMSKENNLESSSHLEDVYFVVQFLEPNGAEVNQMGVS